MSRPKTINFLDLPYEMHALIFKCTFLSDAKALACTCQKMSSTYREMNNHLTDKISFNSERDDFKKCSHITNLKEFILDYFPSDTTYNECIEFCLRQKRIEKIKLYGLIYDGPSPCKIFNYPALKHLKELELEFITAPSETEDYLLPFIQNTTTLRKLSLRNSILQKETMEQISRNENLGIVKFQNVFIFNIIHFRIMLSNLRRIRKFTYFYFRFTRLMNMVRTVEAIFDIFPSLPLLQDLKITVWQELNLPNLHATVTHKRQYHTFVLTKGNAASFFRAIIPLVNSFRLHDFELFYFNKFPTLTELENATIKYNITDDETQIVKFYDYTTEKPGTQRDFFSSLLTE